MNRIVSMDQIKVDENEVSEDQISEGMDQPDSSTNAIFDKISSVRGVVGKLGVPGLIVYNTGKFLFVSGTALAVSSAAGADPEVQVKVALAAGSTAVATGWTFLGMVSVGVVKGCRKVYKTFNGKK